MVGLGQKGVPRVAGNCLKYLKRGWNRKEGKGKKDFKRGGKLDQGVGALKKAGGEGGWAGTSLQTIHYIPVQAFFIFIVLQKVFSHFLWELCFVVKYLTSTVSMTFKNTFF